MIEAVRLKNIVKLLLLSTALWLAAVTLPHTFSDNTTEQVEAYIELSEAYHSLELAEIEDESIDESIKDDSEDLIIDDDDYDDLKEEVLCDPEKDEFCAEESRLLSITRAEYESMTRNELVKMAEEGGYEPIGFIPNRMRLGFNACPNVLEGGFNYNVIVDGTICVATGSQLNAAWNSNANTRRIILMNNITVEGAIGSRTNRTAPIEIDGNGRTPDGLISGNGPQGDGFVLTQGGAQAVFRTSAANAAYQETLADGGGALFYLHSIVIARTGTNSPVGNPAGGSLINDDVDWAFSGGTAASPTQQPRTATWRFRFGNIRTSNITNVVHENGRATSWSLPGVASGPGRLVRAHQAEVTFYGDMLLSTRAENVFVGKLLIEDGTTYVGNINYADHSTVWFTSRMNANSTGSDPSCGALTLPAERPTPGVGPDQIDCRNSVVIGKGANVQMTASNGAGDTYPPIYAHWRNIIVGEDAVVQIASNLPAIAFASNVANTNESSISGATQTVRIESGATFMGTRLGIGLVIGSSSPNINTSGAGNVSNATIEVRPNASFFAIGTHSNAPIIDLSGTNNQLIIEHALAVDLRNENINEHARIFQRHAGATYSLNNMNMVLWENGVGTAGATGAANASTICSPTTSSTCVLNTRLPDHAYNNVASLNITGAVNTTGTQTAANWWASTATGVNGANWAEITSSHEHLQQLIQRNIRATGTATTVAAHNQRNIGRFRRIAATNQESTAYLIDAVTDADLSIHARAILMELPISIGTGMNVIGQPITYRAVYAARDQADIWILDSFIDPSDPKLMSIDEAGIGSWMDPENRFQISGREIQVWAQGNLEHNLWLQDEPTTTTVLDVTPPEPAVFTAAEVTTLDYVISGTASEIGVGVTVEITGASLPNGRLSLTSVVTDDGAGNGVWNVEIPEREHATMCHANILNADYTVQVLLHDGARTLTLEDDFNFPNVHENPVRGVPSTHLGMVANSQIGNQNPRTPIAYRDASFMPGPSLTVTQCVVVSFSYNYPEANNDGIFKQVGININRTVEAPTESPTRTGYQFTGWSADAAGQILFDFEAMTIPTDTTIYAQWIPLVDFEFTKVNQFYHTPNDPRFKRLEGAVFNLYIQQTSESETSDWVQIATDVKSDADGFVHFENLVSGNRFKLIETSAPENFRTPDGHWYIEILENREITIRRSFDEDGNVYEDVPFVQSYTLCSIDDEACESGYSWFVGNMPSGAEFSFTKTNDYLYLYSDLDEIDPDTTYFARLSGAKFELRRWVYDPEQPDNGAWSDVLETVISDTFGLVAFETLLTPDGVYQLKEIAPPTGFRRPHGYWRVRWNEMTEQFEFEAQGTLSLVPAFRIIEYEVDGELITFYYVGNFPETILPRTGGSGVMLITTIGTLSLVFVTLLYMRKKVSDDLEALSTL